MGLMKRGATILAAVATALLISMFASGGPITGGGLTRVSHGSDMFGSGTSSSPLDLRHDCTSGSGLAWSGSAWNCAAIGGGGGGGSGGGYGSALGSGAITVAFTAMAANVDLSTLGTIDWEWQGFLAFGTGAMSCGVANTACHMKLAGGAALANLGVWPIDSGEYTSFPTAAFGVSSDATDDLTKNALAATGGADGVTKSTSGYGLRFPLPSPGGNIQRVARIYIHLDSNTVTCTAHPLDSSATDGTATNTLGSGSTGAYEIKVTYTTNTDSIVSVQCIATSVANTSSKIAWMGTSLGAI